MTKSNKIAKRYSEVKWARSSRRYLCNGQKRHQISLRMYNRASRQDAKRYLKNWTE